MISSQSPPKNEIVLPVSGQKATETPIRWETHYFIDFRQKLNQIGPHMLVAWSGRPIEAKSAIEHLRNGYKSIDPTDYRQLLSVFNSVTELGLKKTSLIALIANEERWGLLDYGHDVRRIETPWGENAVVEGTGEDHLIEALFRDVTHKIEDKWNNAVGRLILAAARMWFWDVSGVGPQLAFGGAYELAVAQIGRVSKLEDIVYVNHVYVPNQGIRVVPVFKKVDYFEDNLVVRILDFSDPPKSSGADVKYRRTAVYLIPPVDKRWSDSSPPPTMEEVLGSIPDMNASLFATHVSVNSTKPNIDPYSFVHHEYRTIDRPIKFKYEGSSQLPSEFFFEQRYIDEIAAGVKDRLAKAGEPVW